MTAASRHRAQEGARSTDRAPETAAGGADPLPRFLTTRQLAAYLCYTGPNAQQSAQKFVKRHGLARRWRGRCVLIARADVDAVIEGRQRQTEVKP
jgi:hypothetical protein